MGTAFLYGNGGSGGTGATLTITAPVGCTVTISKDGKTKTKTAGADGVAVFKGLATGTWTVTITDGTQTASKPVEIVADYDVMMDYKLILYDNGDQCVDVTGGWVKRGKAKDDLTIGQVTFGDSAITLSTKAANSGTGRYNAVFCTTAQLIDVTNYDKLYAFVSEATTGGHMAIYADNTSWNSEYIAVAKRTIGKGETGIIDLDITGITGLYYVGFLSYSELGGSGKITVTKAVIE